MCRENGCAPGGDKKIILLNLDFVPGIIRRDVASYEARIKFPEIGSAKGLSFSRWFTQNPEASSVAHFPGDRLDFPEGQSHAEMSV